MKKLNSSKILVTICAAFMILALFGVSSTQEVDAQSKKVSDEGWKITNTIPYPDQASQLVFDAIKKAGQPNVAAMNSLSFANDQAIIDFAKNKDAASGATAKQLAENLGVTVKEETIGRVIVRYVTPPNVSPRHKNRLFIHIHGGAYVLNGGYGSTGEAILIAHYSKIAVVSIDYRMPPNHPFPAAIDDVLAVYQELIKIHDPSTIAIGGTSAGGGLTMAAIHKFKEVGLELPGALFCGTPWTDLTKTGDSYFTNEGIDRVLVSYEGLLDVAAKSYAGNSDLKNPLISPIYGDFSGFPPTYLVTGTRDLFLSITVRAHRKLKIAGVVADLNVYEGLSHGEYAFVIGSAECIQVYSELSDFLDSHLK